MTVSSTNNRVVALGNSLATTFSFSPMVLFQSSDLVVTKTDINGVDTTLTEGIGSQNYIVNVTSYPGTGTITYPATGTGLLANGEKLTITRDVPLTQNDNLQNQGGYFPKTVETALDKLTILSQQLQEQVDRAVKTPITNSTLTPDQLIASIQTSQAASEDSASRAESRSGIARVYAQQAAQSAKTAAGLTQNAGRLLNIVYITATGTYTKNNNASFVIVDVVGGGGAGGGTPTTGASNAAAGGGGGAGGYARQKISNASLPSSVSVTVGTGGAGSAGANGGNGNTSIWNGVLSAAGGGGGGVGSANTGTGGNSAVGLGGAGSGGDLNEAGGSGDNGLIFAGTSAIGGSGGDSFLGGGAVNNGVGVGNNAASHGAGGSGASATQSTGVTRAGGNGKDGIVIVYEYA